MTDTTGISSITEPPTPTDSRASKDMIIAEVQRTTNQVEQISVERIDSLIARLESLKSAIVLEHRAGVERITSFVELVDQGLREVSKLEELMPKLEATTRT